MRAFSRVGTLLHTAHAQDFERRRRPEFGVSGVDDDDDDDDDGGSDIDNGVEMLKNQQSALGQSNPRESEGAQREAEGSDVERGMSTDEASVAPEQDLRHTRTREEVGQTHEALNAGRGDSL